MKRDDIEEFKIIIPTKILNEVCRFIGIAKPAKDSKIEVNVASNQVSFIKEYNGTNKIKISFMQFQYITF